MPLEFLPGNPPPLNFSKIPVTVILMNIIMIIIITITTVII